MAHPDQINMSLEDVLRILSKSTGIFLYIHKNFVPVFASDHNLKILGFNNLDEFMQLGSIIELIPEDNRELLRQRYQETLDRGYTDPLTINNMNRDGTESWVKIQDQRILFHGETCVLTLLIDISAEVEAREAYRALAEKEQQEHEQLQSVQSMLIEQEKQNAIHALLTGVSHQLNTPLGNIYTSISVMETQIKELKNSLANKTLKLSTLNEALSEFEDTVQVIDKSVMRASKLIKNVKYMVSDNSTAERTEFRLKPLVRDTMKLVQSSFEDINVLMALNIDDQIISYSNPNIWMQLISVLYENSLIHGFKGRSSGRTQVDAELTENHLRLVFSDDGAGIDTSRRVRIFDAFYSSTMSENAGLGLALAYNLVTRVFQGSIALVEPVLGQGCSMQMILPSEYFRLHTSSAPVVNAHLNP
ncbi:MAG: PAS domain-containing sensor histidine kinase [Reinekea sp.]